MIRHHTNELQLITLGNCRRRSLAVKCSTTLTSKLLAGYPCCSVLGRWCTVGLPSELTGWEQLLAKEKRSDMDPINKVVSNETKTTSWNVLDALHNSETTKLGFIYTSVLPPEELCVQLYWLCEEPAAWWAGVVLCVRDIRGHSMLWGTLWGGNVLRTERRIRRLGYVTSRLLMEKSVASNWNQGILPFI